MATVKFYRGLLSAYDSTAHKDGIYFATDKGDIIVNDVHYGMNSDSLDAFQTAINNKIASIVFVSPDTFKVTDGNGNEEIYTIPGASDSTNGVMSSIDKIKLDNIAEGAQVNVLEGVQVDGTDLTITDKKVNIDLQSKLDALKSAYEAADSALKTELLGEVSDTDAKTIAALNDKIDTVEGDAKTYKVVALTTEEIEALSDGANVKEAYKVVDEDDNTVGDIIKVYKDSSLNNVELTDADADGNAGQFLKFSYTLANGNPQDVYVNVSTFLAESEFGNGLVVNNLSGVVSVKIDESEDSEDFLTVSENGIKLSGVQDAINSAVAAEETRATGVEAQLRADLGNPAEGAKSAIERITALETVVGVDSEGGGESLADKVAANTSAIEAIENDYLTSADKTELQGNIDAVANAAATKTALEEEVNRAKAAEEANAQAIVDAKNTIDAYTVNDYPISNNPTLNGGDIALTNYTAITGGMISENDTVNSAINKIDNALVWHEA